MSRAVLYFLISLLTMFIVLFLSPFASAEEERKMVLQSDAWTIRIYPDSLQMIAEPKGKTQIQISAPQENLGPVENLKRSGSEVSWELPEERLTISTQLDGETLSVQLRSGDTGAFTWPIVSNQTRIRGYILPLFEGSYVPSEDARWLAFLADQSPMNTTEGLSMPFWGLDCGDYTLTYILTNPFNNELAFEGREGRLATRFMHAFTRNWERKEYGLIIRLGDASPVAPAKQYRQWLIQGAHFVSIREKIKKVPSVEKLLGAAHIYLWGDGVSVKMMEQFAENGFDRLWLGLDTWQGGYRYPQAVMKAKALGYLIGPYDSYHSIHHPDEPDTWETAQFDLELYKTGAVVRADGTKKRGFQGKGYHLNPIAARPYVEKRVTRIMAAVPFNSWFIDCDAYGELFDDYSELHPATQEDDMNARLDRMSWIRDTYKVVIGSEGGAAYAAPVIHFAHGMMTPVIGWGDPDLQKNKASKYYLGGYWPPDGPAVFMKPVPLKEQYRYFYFAPQFRLPLYETVFHDSVVATHQWGYGSLKFSDQMDTVELLELLYNVPPLYHLNLKEFDVHKARIKAHSAFFSPLHRELGLLPMTDFVWLTPDRMVQRTTFGNRVEMVANFGTADFNYQGDAVPKRSILAKWRDTGETQAFTPSQYSRQTSSRR
ncbi:glycoside hydrolase [Candidatus Poribacteria bacterium]|nr:glycoside hydrolase [Candidatus Poribacteria bacterium]